MYRVVLAGLVVVTGLTAGCARDRVPVAVPSATTSPSPSPSFSPEPSPTPSPSSVTRSPSPKPSPKPSPRPSPARTPSRSPSPTTAPVRSLAAFRGLGTWVDVYDFSREFGGAVKPSAVDTMAAAGVRTIYLQAAKEHAKTPGLLVSSDLLGEWLQRAHAKGMRVVAWYLPTFVDPDRDWAHLSAMLAFRSGGQAFDAIGVDIESRDQADLELRNERLVALSRKLRAAAPGLPLQGIVLPPVVTDVINPAYWPDFPWSRIASSYDVWSPMAYWTNRTTESGWRDAHRYTAENIRLTRANLGRPGAVVHVVGGIGDKTTAADVDGFTRAAAEQRAIGGSLYDYATTDPARWPGLRKVPS